MTNEQRKALTNIINAIEDGENYAVKKENKPEENAAIATFLKRLFTVENGKVKDFNDKLISEYAEVRRCPTMPLL